MASADGMKPGVPVAIVGVGCRFPGGANSLETFHQLLFDGVDAIRDVPRDRWSTDAHASSSTGLPGKSYSRWGGFIDGIDRFEPEAFGISAREAAVMDPQQRLLLELVWEAHADAGIPLSDVAKSRTGVFVGISTLDYSQLQSAPASKSSLQSFTALGTSLSIAANRLSYCLDARGPSFIVDTACSSSLVALDRAVRSLQSGECDQAIVCGVNALLSPEVFISFSAASMLSPDGRCKAFDASANGFVRAEGGGALVLRRLSDARKREDRVHAQILGSGVNQDGRTTGLAMPNGESQARLMREIYSTLGIETSRIAYLEAHGTGTAIGDPTEAHSIGEVFGEARNPKQPLAIGSVKTNIGHLEAGSGMAGVLKAVLSLKNRLIYRNLHFREPNPRIAFKELNLRVPVETEGWPDDGQPAITGVNSFGFGGTNAHVVLAEEGAAVPAHTSNGHVRRATAAVPAKIGRRKATAGYVLPITARNETALSDLAGSFAEYLCDDEVDLAGVCRTAAKRRTLYPHRLCVSGESADALIDSLRGFLEGERLAGSGTGQVRPGHRPLVMIFGGQGPQHAGMGLELMRRYPVFRDVMRRCDELIAKHVGWSILAEIERSPETSRIDETQFAQPGLFVVQAAIAALWKSWGIVPSCVVGHSVGEVAAAWAAGAMDLESACQVIAYRSSTMQEARSGGAMLACALTADEAKERIRKFNHEIFLGAVNGPRQVTLSGEAEAVDALARELERDDVWYRALRVSHAFHSSAMDSAEAPLRRGLARLTSEEPQIRMISTVTGGEVAAGELDADYWWRNVRDSVEFEPAMRVLMQEAEPIFLEISPHPVLSSGISECARAAKVSVDVFASQRRKADSEQTIRGALCNLFCVGASPEWDSVLPAGDWCWDLPTHPWQRERFWHENPDVAATRIPQAFHPLLGFRRTSGVGTWEQTLGVKAFPWLKDHRVKGSVVVPGAAYVELMLAALSQSAGAAADDESKQATSTLSLKNVQFQRALFLAGDAAPGLQVTLSEEDHSISIHSRAGVSEGTPWVRNAVAEWSSSSAVGSPEGDLESAKQRCSNRDSIEELYSELLDQGLEYGPVFRGVRELWKGEPEAVARIQIDESLADDVSVWWCHPTVLDACFQVFASLVPREYRHALKLPVRADYIRVWDKLEGEIWCHVAIRRASEWSVEGDIFIYGPDGRLIAEIEGFRCQAASWVSGKSSEEAGPKTYRTGWHEAPLEEAAEAACQDCSAETAIPTPTAWLVFADSQGVGDAVIERLESRGCDVIAVRQGTSFEGNCDEGYRVCPESPDQMTELISRVVEWQPAEGKLGVLHCWCADITEPSHAVDKFDRNAALSVDSVVSLAQALANESRLNPRTFGIITRGARCHESETQGRRPGAMAAVGLGRVLANEFSGWTTKLIDLAADSGPAELDQLVDELLSDNPEGEVIWRDGRRLLPRLESGPDLETMHLSIDQVDGYRLEAARPGSVDHLQWVPWQRTPPAAGEVEIAVEHVAINFRDVLKCLGLYPADRPEELLLGDECCGMISTVGPDVEGFAVGDRVVGCVPGCFRSHVNAPAAMLLPVLPDWETHDAATVPIAFLTAWYSLRTLGHLEPGETVLIHAAAGGVGLAAVQIAQMIGARVFATAGSEEKRQMLRDLSCELVMDSRSLAFADQIRKHTEGRGVDVVLNSLAGEALIRSVDSLAPYGRFLEIGKRDLFSNSKLGMWPLRLNGSFHAIDLGAVLQEKPVLAKKLLRELRESLESGRLRPLPHTQWKASKVADAFRLMSQGKHAGKQVVDVRDPELAITTTDVPHVTFESEGTYVVSGGLGGFGYETAKWIVERGATRVVLLSRRSSNAPEAETAVEELQELGAEAVAISCDVSDRAQLSDVFGRLQKTHPPVRGIFHAAMVIDDAPIAHLTPERIAAVLRPKALGAWNLHEVSEDCPLDHFVLFGSVSASLGNRGQGNYAAANAMLEGLAEYRHSRGLPATTVGWGFVSEVGFAADKKELMKMALRNGFHASTPKEYLDVLERLLPRACDTVVVGEFDWETVAQSFYRNRDPHGLMTSLVEDYVGRAGRSVDTSRLREEMETMAGEQRVELLSGYLQSQVARILGLAAAKVDADRPIVELGLDSLMGIELATVIEQDLATALPNLSVSRDLTVSKLTRDLLVQLGYAVGEHASADAKASSDSERTASECLIPLRDGTDGPGLICLHPVGGAIEGYSTLAGALDESLSVYAVQSRVLFGQDEYSSLEAMVAAYTDRLRSEFPDGPYRLFGFSLGGYLAASIAEQLEAGGATVEFVGIADCPDYVSSTAEDSLEQFTRLLIGAYEEFAAGMPALRPLQESDRAGFRTLAERLSRHRDNGHDQVVTWLTERGLVVGELPERTLRQHVSRMTQHLKLVSDCRTMPVVRAPMYVWKASRGIGALSDGWHRVDDLPVTEFELEAEHSTLLDPPTVEEIAGQINSLFAMKAAATK